jgi:hypothetical protein
MHRRATPRRFPGLPFVDAVWNRANSAPEGANCVMRCSRAKLNESSVSVLSKGVGNLKLILQKRIHHAFKPRSIMTDGDRITCSVSYHERMPDFAKQSKSRSMRQTADICTGRGDRMWDLLASDDTVRDERQECFRVTRERLRMMFEATSTN